MKCPRDGASLVFTDQNGHLQDRCPSCSGILLDRDEVIAALGRRQGRAFALDATRAKSLPPSQVACPRDGARMGRLEHGGIELEVCPTCNALWLDAGELEKLRESRARAVRRTAAVAGAAGLAAAPPTKASVAGQVAGEVAEFAGEVALEGLIDLAFEFAVDAIGSLLS